MQRRSNGKKIFRKRWFSFFPLLGGALRFTNSLNLKSFKNGKKSKIGQKWLFWQKLDFRLFHLHEKTRSRKSKNFQIFPSFPFLLSSYWSLFQNGLFPEKAKLVPHINLRFFWNRPQRALFGKGKKVNGKWVGGKKSPPCSPASPLDRRCIRCIPNA